MVKKLTRDETKALEQTARTINSEVHRHDYLGKESQRIMKLPNHVWEDVKHYLKSRHGLGIPKKKFSFSQFLYKSNKFRFEEFVNNISLTKTRVMFSLCARRLGIGLVHMDDAYHFIPLKHLSPEGIQELYDAYKASERFDIHIDGQEPTSETDNVVPIEEA